MEDAIHKFDYGGLRFNVEMATHLCVSLAQNGGESEGGRAFSPGRWAWFGFITLCITLPSYSWLPKGAESPPKEHTHTCPKVCPMYVDILKIVETNGFFSS